MFPVLKFNVMDLHCALNFKNKIVLNYFALEQFDVIDMTVPDFKQTYS